MRYTANPVGAGLPAMRPEQTTTDVEVNMYNWIDALADLQNRGEPCVLVTIIEELGSTPRNAGSKMVISANQAFDTIGGGHLEYKAMQIAREMLASGKSDPHL